MSLTNGVLLPSRAVEPSVRAGHTQKRKRTTSPIGKDGHKDESHWNFNQCEEAGNNRGPLLPPSPSKNTSQFPHRSRLELVTTQLFNCMVKSEAPTVLRSALAISLGLNENSHSREAKNLYMNVTDGI